MKKGIVLITGASRGIGHAIALWFARAGYAVAITSCKSEEELKEVQEELKLYHTPVLACLADAGDYKQMETVLKRIQSELGEVDILVNNAGISWVGLFQDMKYETYENIIQTNLISVLNCSHLVIPGMVRKKAGKIINISSVWGNVGASCEAVYSAAKSGINGFTKALGKELAPCNIQVNAVACGVIETKMNQWLSKEEKEELKQDIPAGRFGTAEEVAELVFQLAIGHSYLTGQVISLDGGWI